MGREDALDGHLLEVGHGHQHVGGGRHKEPSLRMLGGGIMISGSEPGGGRHMKQLGGHGPVAGMMVADGPGAVGEVESQEGIVGAPGGVR